MLNKLTFWPNQVRDHVGIAEVIADIELSNDRQPTSAYSQFGTSLGAEVATNLVNNLGFKSPPEDGADTFAVS